MPKALRVRGFTLIELLVVISIIGVLSSVVLASLNTARSKANDAARIADVKSLKIAMELYYNQNSTYPKAGLTEGAGYNLNNATFMPLLVPAYISTMPAILVNDGDGYVYSTTAGTSGKDGYGIHVYLQNTSAYTDANGWCKTGVNIQAGWWGNSVPTCNF